MSDAAARYRHTTLRRETVLSAIVNAGISIGFFLAAFGWNPADVRPLAIDFLPQTFGITFLGGLVPSLIMLSRVHKGGITPAGSVPTRAAQARRVLGLALLAMPVLGGAAALAMVALGPATISPEAALMIKAVYGGLVGIATTPPILRKALGMSYWPRAVRHSSMLVKN